MDAQDEERPLIHHLPPQDETSEFTSDGTVDISNLPARKQTTGNWTACFFILGAEFAECVAFFAISKNLVTYLTGVLHESNVNAATTVSTWIGTAFFTPLIGAFLADTFWGRYWTIVIFISVYVIGMMILTGSALLPLLMGLSYNRGIHRLTAYLGLYLVALGNGGIKPCVCALGADQFDAADPVERVTKGSFFNWYYFSVNIGSLLSATVVVWVQDNVGWGVGFAIPTALMLSGLAVFVAGRNVYRYQRVEGSPLTRVSQVVVAAVRNYHLVLPEDSSALHQLPSPAEGNHCKIQHTSQFRRLSLAHAAPDRQTSMSIMWQAPAFAVLGAGEVFTAIGTLEFFYDQSPDGMKSLGTALAHLATAAGNYINSAVLAAVATVTTRNGKPGWIPDDLNKGHLDYFFWLMAVLGVVNLLYFLHCSIRVSSIPLVLTCEGEATLSPALPATEIKCDLLDPTVVPAA